MCIIHWILIVLLGLTLLVNMFFNSIVNTLKKGEYKNQIRGWYCININKVMWVNIIIFVALIFKLFV